MKALVLYGKRDCHLCDEMKAVVDEVRREIPLSLEVVDITGNGELEDLYAAEVPVLFIDGRKTFKYRADATALRRRLGKL